MYKTAIFSTALGASQEQLELFCHGCQEMHNFSPSGLFGRHLMPSVKSNCTLECRTSLQKQQTGGPSQTIQHSSQWSDCMSNHHLLLTSNEVVCTGIRLNLNSHINRDMKKNWSPKLLKNKKFIEKLLCYWLQKEYKAVLGSSLCISAILAFLKNLIKPKSTKLLSHF